MKVSELEEGADLDYWVAKAEGHQAEIIADEKGPFVVRTILFDGGGHSRGPFFPSTQWHDGGPIIERKKIAVVWAGKHFDAYVNADYGGPDGQVDCAPHDIAEGPTYLVAGMRAHVASVYGEEVSQPPGD